MVSAVEDCVGAAPRALKRGRFVAEDLMEKLGLGSSVRRGAEARNA